MLLILLDIKIAGANLYYKPLLLYLYHAYQITYKIMHIKLN